MANQSNHETSVELLQQLGLKEYEARCFVTLSRMPSGTAKEISEVSEVPRTRVYDAIRVLEARGLVEVQHSSPQQFRAVPVGEAAETLREEFESRTDQLVGSLQSLDRVAADEEKDVAHEVWALSGTSAIGNRTEQIVEGTERELLLVVGDETALTAELVEALGEARNSGVTVIVGTASEDMRDQVRDVLPEAEVFLSELEWLDNDAFEDDTTISRLLLADRNTILVSTVSADSSEKAIFGTGFENGLVVVARRLMATGLSSLIDPGTASDLSTTDG